MLTAPIPATRHALDKGFCFYWDMCKGRVDGVSASEKHWATYERLRELRFLGRRPKRGVVTNEELFHPEVIKRRRDVHRGVELIDSQGWQREMDKIRSSADNLPSEKREELEKRGAELAKRAS